MTKEEILEVEAVKHGDYYQGGNFDGFDNCIFSAMDIYAKQMAISFLDAIKDYEHESGNQICCDERSSKELFEMFVNTSAAE